MARQWADIYLGGPYGPVKDKIYWPKPARWSEKCAGPVLYRALLKRRSSWQNLYKKITKTVSQGSFRVKSPKITENLNPTVSDFNETWYTCCLGTHSTKSKILGQSDQWCGRYGPPNFESFGKNVRGCQPLNPHISGTSDPIFIKLVLMDRQFDKDSKYVILVQIGECLGALTFRPLL